MLVLWRYSGNVAALEENESLQAGEARAILLRKGRLTHLWRKQGKEVVATWLGHMALAYYFVGEAKELGTG